MIVVLWIHSKVFANFRLREDHLLRLRQAYLDVFGQEPLPGESPLRELPNCLILPHVSANAPEYVDLFIDELLERLSAE